MAKWPPADQPTPGNYHVALNDETKKMMESSSFNFYMTTGNPVRVPPKLYSDLKAAGVSMKYMVADASLEQ